MLGWEIFIRRKYELESNDPKTDIARWAASINGLSWIEDFVGKGEAILLDSGGYPTKYSIKAGLLRAILNKGTPSHNSPPIIGDDYYMPERYSSPLQVDHEKLNRLPDNEELIIEAWDLS